MKGGVVCRLNYPDAPRLQGFGQVGSQLVLEEWFRELASFRKPWTEQTLVDIDRADPRSGGGGGEHARQEDCCGEFQFHDGLRWSERTAVA
jgi:hypothetical protein